MADFNSIEDFLIQAEKDAKEVLIKEAYYLQEMGRDYIIQKIYSVYSPTRYARTGEILDAIQVKVTPNSNGLEVSVYVSDEIMHKQSNWMEGVLTTAPWGMDYEPENPMSHNGTMSKVLQYFAEGYGYGDARFGKSLDPMYEIAKYVDSGQAQDDLMNMLKQKGYNIV